MSATPKDRKYSQTHEWFQAAGDLVTVGISKFAADELTDITFVDLPAPGTEVAAGRPFGVIESVKATSDLVSSITGEVVEINSRLADEPELVNNDPFGDGWMIKVRASDTGGLDALMDADAYDRTLAQS